jgi:hypothetical protein
MVLIIRNGPESISGGMKHIIYRIGGNLCQEKLSTDLADFLLHWEG